MKKKQKSKTCLQRYWEQEGWIISKCIWGRGKLTAKCGRRNSNAGFITSPGSILMPPNQLCTASPSHMFLLGEHGFATQWQFFAQKPSVTSCSLHNRVPNHMISFEIPLKLYPSFSYTLARSDTFLPTACPILSSTFCMWVPPLYILREALQNMIFLSNVLPWSYQ